MTTLQFISILDDIRAERVRILNERKKGGGDGDVPDWPDKTGPHWGIQWNILKPSQVQKWAMEGAVLGTQGWALEFMTHVADVMAEKDEKALAKKLTHLGAWVVLWLECLKRRAK
jgi:hypothetical protein